ERRLERGRAAVAQRRGDGREAGHGRAGAGRACRRPGRRDGFKGGRWPWRREEEMKVRGTQFRLDKANGKVAGVCAGLGETTGLDPNVIRIGFVLAAVLGSFIAAMIVYAVLAMAGSPKGGLSRRPASAAAR